MTIEGLHVVREGQGTPLLFLTGLGGRAEFWAPQFARFRDARDCIGFDHRKTGDSMPSDVTTTVQALADDAIRLLDSLKIEACDMIGHSLGGAIAQHIAVHHPHRIKRLVLSASWCGPTPYFLELFGLRKRVLRECGPRDYLLQGNLLGNPAWWNFENHHKMTAGIEARLASFAGVEIECERMDAVTSHDLRGRVREIAAETLVVCAWDDAITPINLSWELHDLIAGAKIEALNSGGHFAPVTVPDEWAAEVKVFLS